MIIEKEVLMRWDRSNVKYYTARGYELSRYGEFFNVKVEDLPNGSPSEITVICDACNSGNKKMRFNRYTKTKAFKQNGLGSYLCFPCACRLTNEQFLERLEEKYRKEYIPLEEYVDAKTKIRVIHSVCGHEWLVAPSNLLNNKGCPKCAKNLQYTTESFKQRLYELVQNEYSLIGEYSTSSTKTRMRHNYCEYEWDIVPNSFINGTRCAHNVMNQRVRGRFQTFSKSIILSLLNNTQLRSVEMFIDFLLILQYSKTIFYFV